MNRRSGLWQNVMNKRNGPAIGRTVPLAFGCERMHTAPLDQPFTAPCTMPSTISFWKAVKTAMGGMIAMVMTAPRTP